jgi:small subunit ribosomal protein S20
MANNKQQVKRNLTNEKRRLQNASVKSSLRTALKAVDAAVANKDAEGAKAALAFACKKLDKAVSKGFLHKNNAARHKSALCKKVNSL